MARSTYKQPKRLMRLTHKHKRRAMGTLSNAVKKQIKDFVKTFKINAKGVTKGKTRGIKKTIGGLNAANVEKIVKILEEEKKEKEIKMNTEERNVRRSTRTRKSVVKNNGNSSTAKPLNRKKQFKEKSMKKSEEQLKEMREEKKLEDEKKRVEATGNIGKSRLSRKNLKGNSKKTIKATRKNASAPRALSVIPENSIPQENINANLLAAFKKLSLSKSK